MTRAALLYAIIGGAALLAAVGVPWLVHTGGSAAVPGWRGLIDPGALSASHAALSGQCEACHTPHRGVDGGKCAACHAATPFADKASTGFHTEARSCRGCHVEHEGRRAPTRMDHAQLLRRDVWWAPGVAPPGDGPPLLRPLHGRETHATAVLDCYGCHGAKDPHRQLFGTDCAACHGVKAWTVPGFQHPAMASTQCSECHRAPPSHAMMHFSMVSQRVAGRRAEVEQCQACHATDDWNNIRGRGIYDHH